MTHIVGSAAITPRDDQGGARLFLDRALWRTVGEPPAMRLFRAHGVLVLAPGAEYQILGAIGGQPRLALGVRKLTELGIIPDQHTTHEAYAYLASRRILIRHTPTLPPEIAPASLVARRTALGLSQPAFAAAIGVELPTLRQWEHGRRRPRYGREVEAAIQALEDQRK